MTHLKAKDGGRRKFPLRFFLIVPFVLQIFSIVSLVGYLSFRNGQKAVYDLANQLMRETSRTIDQHLKNYLQLPHHLNEINAHAVRKGHLDLKDVNGSKHYFWKQAQTFKNISWIGYALPSGETVGAGPWFDGKNIVVNHTSSNHKDYGYATDTEGNITELVYTTEYDAVNDTWYVDAVKAGKPVWGRITPTEGYDAYVAAIASYPIYNSDRQLMGILAVDFQLADISHYLHQLNISRNGKIFIIERDGLLIANSALKPNFQVENGQVKRLKATEIANPLIQDTAKHLLQKFGNYQVIQNIQEFNVQIQGAQYFLHIRPWKDQYGLDWLVIVVLPESDFMQQIHANTRTTILMCFLAFGCATVIGIYTSKWISKPILYLSQASEAIASGDLTQEVQTSLIKEIHVLATSFNIMADKLSAAFAELEQNNVALENRVAERTIELKNALNEIKDAQTQLIQSEKMSSLGHLIAGIAHEINNPITFIYSNLTHIKEYSQDLIRLINVYQKNYDDYDPPPEIQKIIEEIEFDFLTSDLMKTIDSMQNGAERIRNIVQSLRTFSRLDEAVVKKIDIHEGIESTLMILQHRLQAPNSPEIQVIKRYGNLPKVECYAGQLNQVFMNILLNAIEAVEECGGVITIDTELDNGFAVVQIADNGSGISDDIKERIFDPFFTTKPVGKGTGLGLSICYQIVVKKHQGQLQFDSKLGEGTVFSISIPQRLP